MSATRPALIQGVALPGRTEKRGRRVGHAGAGPVVHAAQVVQRGDNRLAGWRRVERDPLQQGGEQRAHAPPVRAQFPIPPVVGRGDQAVDAGHGGLDVGPGNLLEQGIPPSGDRQRVVLVGHDACWPTSRSMMAAASRSRSERSLDLRCASSARAKMSVASASNSSTASSSAVASKVWNRAARVAVRRGSCSAARLAGLADARTARQPPERGSRQVGGWRQPRPWPRMASMRSRCRSSSVGERRFGAARRSSSVASVASSEVTSATSFCRCCVGQGAGQAAPEPQGRAIAHAADQALERGDAGQQHLVRQQPGGGPVEQQPRAVVPGPAQHVEPAGQPEAGGRVLLQVAEPVVLADGRGMAPALPAVAVGVQAGRRLSPS